MGLLAVAATPVQSAGIDSRIAIERAVLQIELADYALARSYLGRPLIDPRITVTERSRAYYLQGYSLELQGHHVSAAQNYVKALTFNADNPATLAALGHLYANGLGIARDQTQANELLRRSAELGHAPGMTRLGAMLLAGLASSPQPAADLTEARAWLTNATEVDDGEAFLFLAHSHRPARTSSPDAQAALRYYQQALVLNQADAFNSIGHMHLNGEFGAADPTAAAAAFLRGSNAGNSPSQVSLGYLYLRGNGVEADRHKARDLFISAAAAGEVRAHHYLGYLAETDKTNEPADPEASDTQQTQNTKDVAIKHYQRAAAGHYPAALLRLSELAFADNLTAAGINYLRRFIRVKNTKSPQPVASAENRYWSANHLLAWLLATHPDAALRNGREALEYAQASVAHHRSAPTLDTLAAAYAEIGDYTIAAETQTAAISLLGEPTTPERLSDYATRLAHYESSKPWRPSTAQAPDNPTENPTENL